MSKTYIATGVALFALLASVPVTVNAQKGLIAQKALSLDLSMTMAQTSLEWCRAKSYKCAVAVIGSTGRPIVILEDDGASLHRFEVVQKKAYTALVYKRSSRDVVEGWSKAMAKGVPLAEGTAPTPPVEGTIAMGGGLPVVVGGEVIGAIAVSGAPGWPADEAAAKAGLDKVADKLK